MKDEILQDSTILASEIGALEQKRDRLQSDLKSAQREHVDARSAVVQVGDQSSLENVTSAHSRTVALTDALSTLEDQIAEKAEELKRAAENERQENVRAEIAARNNSREQARRDYLRSRDRANEALKEPVQAMFEAARRFAYEGDEIKRLYSSIGIETQRPTDKFGASEIQPFGYEVDMAYGRFIRISEREADQARAEERRARRTAA